MIFFSPDFEIENVIITDLIQKIINKILSL